jgi:hypothetical protein
MARVPNLSEMEAAPEYVDSRWRHGLRQAVPYDLRLRARRLLTETPGLSALWCRLDPRMAYTRITRQTRLVIDGFPRSANSYARMAFLYANGEDFPLCSHRHSHQSIRTGVRRHLPTMVLIREPGPAIGSSLQFSPGTRPTTGFDMYRRFYEGVLPVLDDVLIATFDEVTTDFGEVVRRCNTKFGTDFVPYEHTDVAEAAVVKMIDATTAFAFGGDDDDLGHLVPRPSATRRPADDVLAARLDAGDRDAIDELDGLYGDIVAGRTG